MTIDERYLHTIVSTVLAAKGAALVLDAAEKEALRNGWAVSIAVVDSAGDLVAFRRMDRAASASIHISIAKAATAARSRVPTKLLQDRIDRCQPSLLAIPGVTGLQGGVPSTANQIVLGPVAARAPQSPTHVQLHTPHH